MPDFCPACNQFHSAFSSACPGPVAPREPDPLGFNYGRLKQGEADAAAGRVHSLDETMAALRRRVTDTAPPGHRDCPVCLGTGHVRIPAPGEMRDDA